MRLHPPRRNSTRNHTVRMHFAPPPRGVEGTVARITCDEDLSRR